MSAARGNSLASLRSPRPLRLSIPFRTAQSAIRNPQSPIRNLQSTIRNRGRSPRRSLHTLMVHFAPCPIRKSRRICRFFSRRWQGTVGNGVNRRASRGADISFAGTISCKCRVSRGRCRVAVCAVEGHASSWPRRRPDATKRVPPRRGATFRGGTAGAIGIVSVQPIMLLVQPGKDRPRELTVCPRSHIRRSSEATLWDESLNVKARVGVGRATFRAAA